MARRILRELRGPAGAPGPEHLKNDYILDETTAFFKILESRAQRTVISIAACRLQLSATDVSALETIEGAAKGDKHCDLQNTTLSDGCHGSNDDEGRSEL